MEEQESLLRPMTAAWLNKLEIAREVRKKEFDDYADQCMAFYSGALGFMYSKEFQSRYTKGQFDPKFKITLNKPFEFVALIGPLLYARNPDRRVTPFKVPEYPTELIAADMGIDLVSLSEQYQAVQQMQAEAEQTGVPLPPEAENVIVQYEGIQEHLSQLGVVDRLERLNRDALCKVAETYLNFTPGEQPDGGLQEAAEVAITEAMVTGLAMLQPQVYTVPGSNIRLTGCFYKNNRKLLVDPDAESLNFGEATWIALETTEPHFIAERRFKLPYGALKNKSGSSQSGDAMGAVQSREDHYDQVARGTTYDNITYWEIYSTAGVGTRLSGQTQPMQQALHEAVGDFARIVVAQGVPFPLNAPDARFEKATVDEVAKMFAWPVPYWKDRRWPVGFLTFYRNIQKDASPWPMSPMRPALGILVALNIIMSHLVQRSWQSSRTFVAMLKRAVKEFRETFENGQDLQIVEVSEINADLDKCIKFLEQPEVSFDMWRIVEQLFRLLDKATGMSDILYAVGGDSTPRSARDVEERSKNLSVRPDYMVHRVEDWMSNLARMEMLCAYENKIDAESVQPFLGTIGAQLWQNRFLNADPSHIYREVSCRIESGSAKKPNRDRDAANVREIYPVLSQQAVAAWERGDAEPINALNAKLGEALQIDLTAMRFQPPAPEQDEAAMQKAQAEQQKAQIEAQKAEVEIAAKAAEMELKQAEREQAIVSDTVSAEQHLVENTERHIQELVQTQEKHEMDMELMQAEAAMRKKMGKGKEKKE